MNPTQLTHAALSGLGIIAGTVLAVTGHIGGDAAGALILACVGITGALTVPGSPAGTTSGLSSGA